MLNANDSSLKFQFINIYKQIWLVFYSLDNNCDFCRYYNNNNDKFNSFLVKDDNTWKKMEENIK